MTDDHGPVIRYRGIPCVDIINFAPNRATGFGAHWHTSADNMNVIHIETLRAVGETVATTIREDI
jgi:glutamine cyclotransferase-related protein